MNTELVHCCTISLCHLGSEMIITEIQISIQRSSSGLLINTEQVNSLWRRRSRIICRHFLAISIESSATWRGSSTSWWTPLLESRWCSSYVFSSLPMSPCSRQAWLCKARPKQFWQKGWSRKLATSAATTQVSKRLCSFIFL